MERYDFVKSSHHYVCDTGKWIKYEDVEHLIKLAELLKWVAEEWKDE